jgi:hypothetical protein
MLDLAFFEAGSEHQIIHDGETLLEFRTPSRVHALGSKASSLARASEGGKSERLGNTERYQVSQRLV